MRQGHVWLAAAAAAWLLAPVGARAEAPSAAGADLTGQATKALVQGRTEEALAKADAAIKADPHAPWAHYCRAEALASLKRHEEAVAAYEMTASRLPEPDMRNRALAVWGRASSLRQSGHCDEAKKAYAEYVVMMKPLDSQAAKQAEPYAAACQSAGDIAGIRPRAVPPPTPIAEPTRPSGVPDPAPLPPATPAASDRVERPIAGATTEPPPVAAPPIPEKALRRASTESPPPPPPLKP